MKVLLTSNRLNCLIHFASTVALEFIYEHFCRFISSCTYISHDMLITDAYATICLICYVTIEKKQKVLTDEYRTEQLNNKALKNVLKLIVLHFCPSAPIS